MERVNGRKDEGLPDRNGQKKIFRLCAYDFTSRDKNKNCGHAFFLFWRELINCLGIINWLNCLQQLISGNVAPSANTMSWDNINITRARSALQYLAFAVSSFLVHCLQVKYFNFLYQFCVFACVWQAAVNCCVLFTVRYLYMTAIYTDLTNSD